MQGSRWGDGRHSEVISVESKRKSVYDRWREEEF